MIFKNFIKVLVRRLTSIFSNQPGPVYTPLDIFPGKYRFYGMKSNARHFGQIMFLSVKKITRNILQIPDLSFSYKTSFSQVIVFIYLFLLHISFKDEQQSQKFKSMSLTCLFKIWSKWKKSTGLNNCVSLTCFVIRVFIF